MPAHLLISEIGGIFVVLFTLLLLWRGRIYVDAKSEDVIEIKLPWQFTIRTPTPTIMMLILGIIMVIVPIWFNQQSILKCQFRMISIKGNVETEGAPVSMVVVAKPHYLITQENSGEFSQTLPLIPEETYRVHFLINKVLVYDEKLEMVNNEFDLGTVKLKTPPVDIAR